MNRRDREGIAYSVDEKSSGKIPRRIVLEKDKAVLNPSVHIGIDITGMPNANTMNPVVLLVQEQCNLGDWHTINHVELVPWGND